MATKQDQERNKFEKAAKEAAEKAEAAYVKVEGKADDAVDEGISLMQKLKKTKWTAAAVTGAGMLLAFLIIR